MTNCTIDGINPYADWQRPIIYQLEDNLFQLLNQISSPVFTFCIDAKTKQKLHETQLLEIQFALRKL